MYTNTSIQKGKNEEKKGIKTRNILTIYSKDQYTSHHNTTQHNNSKKQTTIAQFKQQQQKLHEYTHINTYDMVTQYICTFTLDRFRRHLSIPHLHLPHILPPIRDRKLVWPIPRKYTLHGKRALSLTNTSNWNRHMHAAWNAWRYMTKRSKIAWTICACIYHACVCMQTPQNANTHIEEKRHDQRNEELDVDYACTVPACLIASLLFTNVHHRICEWHKCMREKNIASKYYIAQTQTVGKSVVR